MFGVDIFNYGHNLSFANEGEGTVSWFSGTKIKIAQYCLIDEYRFQKSIDEGNANANELVVDMNKESIVLFPNQLPGGGAMMKAIYIPNNKYRITISTTNGEEVVLDTAQNIGCLVGIISGVAGDSLNLDNQDSIDSIKIEDKNWVECFNQNRIENDDGSCGVCDKGYFENNNQECVTCAGANQIQLDDKTCGGCLEGFVVDEVEGSPNYGQCVSETPKDNTLLYVGGGLLGVGVLASVLMGKK